jgi:hypothetical protein
LNTDRSNPTSDLLATFLGLPHTNATAKVPNCTNPIALNVHPNPILGSNVLTILGYTSPPVTLPQAAIPVTSGSLLLK